MGVRGMRYSDGGYAYLRVERLGPKVEDWMCEAGACALSAFLVRSVTPPLSPGWTPMALSAIEPSYCDS
jgi:hypothetical protein